MNDIRGGRFIPITLLVHAQFLNSNFLNVADFKGFRVEWYFDERQGRGVIANPQQRHQARAEILCCC